MTAGLRRKSPFLFLFAAIVLILLIPVSVQASTVTINDQAHVLDAGQVRAEGAKLPAALSILTTTMFSGDLDALNSDARQKLPNQQSIVIEIDTVQRNLSVQAGTSVKISDDQASDAVQAFKDKFSDGGYTGATIAAIDSLQASLNGTSWLTKLEKYWAVPVFIAFWVIAIVRDRYLRKKYPHRYSRSTSSSYHNSSSDHSGGSSSSSSDYGGGAGGHF
jgi:hypothetical protein